MCAKRSGADDILLSGVGAHKTWIARYFHCHEPNTCIIPNGFCSMGLALPGRSPRLVHPERKVLGIAGDGDFLMNVQEMETARRLNADITMMVWDDGGYGLISWKQDNEFGTHTDLSFGNPDWEGLAQAFGWQGRHVRDSVDLRPALDEALAHRVRPHRRAGRLPRESAPDRAPRQSCLEDVRRLPSMLRETYPLSTPTGPRRQTRTCRSWTSTRALSPHGWRLPRRPTSTAR